MSDSRIVNRNAHGYKPKNPKHREIKGLMTAGAIEPSAHRCTQSQKEVLHSSDKKLVRGRSNSVTRHANSIPHPHMKTKIRPNRISSASDEEMEQEETRNDRHMRKSLRNSTNSSSDDKAKEKEQSSAVEGKRKLRHRSSRGSKSSSSDEADTK